VESPLLADGPPGRGGVASAWLAGAVVVQDLALAAHTPYATRLLPALAGVLALGLLGGKDGLRGLLASPAGGWWRWARVGVGLGLLSGALLGLWLAGLHLFGGGVAVESIFEGPRELGGWLVRACLLAPGIEEIVYRFLLVAAVLPLLGSRGSVIASGLAFAALHLLYGNPSPENMLGGFVLAWAYVASGSLAVPLLLHAIGNLFVGVFHAALAW